MPCGLAEAKLEKYPSIVSFVATRQRNEYLFSFEKLSKTGMDHSKETSFEISIAY